jgi:hypothetical protein
MKRYTSSQVRERLADVLDAAERGEEVIIERRGVRYFVRAERAKPGVRASRSSASSIQESLQANGPWTWKADGLTFSSKRPVDSPRYQRGDLIASWRPAERRRSRNGQLASTRRRRRFSNCSF